MRARIGLVSKPLLTKLNIEYAQEGQENKVLVLYIGANQRTMTQSNQDKITEKLMFSCINSNLEIYAYSERR